MGALFLLYTSLYCRFGRDFINSNFVVLQLKIAAEVPKEADKEKLVALHSKATQPY
jgi:hypothetical protein